MIRISYKRRRFPPVIIQHAVWRYFRFTFSLRDVEEMLVQRGIEVSYETIRCWTIKFGSRVTANLRRRKNHPRPVAPTGGLYLSKGSGAVGSSLERNHKTCVGLSESLFK